MSLERTQPTVSIQMTSRLLANKRNYAGLYCRLIAVIITSIIIISTISSNNNYYITPITPVWSWTGNLQNLSKPQQHAGTTPLVMTTIWLIDGTNLMCSRAVPNDRDTIIKELQKITPSSNDFANDDDDDENVTTTETQTRTKKKRKRKTMSSVIKNNVVMLIFDGNEDEIFVNGGEAGPGKILIESKWFTCIVTDGKDRRKDRADDYIINYAIPRFIIPSSLTVVVDNDNDNNDTHDSDNLSSSSSLSLSSLLLSSSSSSSSSSSLSSLIKVKVHLVTADKELQKRVQATRVMNGGSCIHPPKFWKDYLPVLHVEQQQQQQRQRQMKKQTPVL